MPISDGLTRNTEFIFCLKSGDSKNHIGEKFKTEFTLWDINNVGAHHENHRACFPVELPEKGICLASNEKDMILDPFLGSGTTLIACERLHRKCRGIEIAPGYVAVTLQRWADMTGKMPVLSSSEIVTNVT